MKNRNRNKIIVNYYNTPRIPEQIIYIFIIFHNRIYVYIYIYAVCLSVSFGYSRKTTINLEFVRQDDQWKATADCSRLGYVIVALMGSLSSLIGN